MDNFLYKLRQEALDRKIPYTYAHLTDKLGIPIGDIENLELYRQGKELIDSGYKPTPIQSPDAQSAQEPSRLERLIEEDNSHDRRVALFLDEAEGIFSLSNDYTVFTQEKRAILELCFPGRFGRQSGSQPLVLTSDIARTVGKVKKYTPYEIGTLFENVYKTYMRK